MLRISLLSPYFHSMSDCACIRWYVSLIMAISRLINTTTETNMYTPKVSLKRTEVHCGWLCSTFSSPWVVCPKTAKKRYSKASTGFIFTGITRHKHTHKTFLASSKSSFFLFSHFIVIHGAITDSGYYCGGYSLFYIIYECTYVWGSITNDRASERASEPTNEQTEERTCSCIFLY